MEPPFLSFYAFNGASQVEPLQLDNGNIVDNRWKNFQSIVDIVIKSAPKSEFEPVLNSSNIPSLNQKQLIVLLSDPLRHFGNAETFKHLIDNPLLRPLGSGNPREGKKDFSEEFCYQPILTIGYEDIMNLYAEEDDQEKEKIDYLRSYNLDPRFKFLDSSIWHRYVPVYSNGANPAADEGNAFNTTTNYSHFKAELDRVLSHLAGCHKKDLYQTNAAKAMLEFQLRMLRDSYIIPFGEQNHARFVTPFKFHSETQMQVKADKLLREHFDANELRNALKWRFLLVDDYANTGISRAGGNIKTSKKELIRYLLAGFDVKIDYPRENGDKGKKSAKTDIIEKCLSKLSAPPRYDILLLDYLLAISQKKLEREYGYEFLQELQKDSEEDNPKYKRGPFMRYWIFPISSFPFALYDKLRQLGIDNYHELWHLSGGGDPITTPQLFRYNLLNFLKQQVLEAYLDDESLARRLSTYSSIQDREIWSEVTEAYLGHLLAQIKILKSYQQDNRGKSEHFSASLYQHILSTGYYEVLEKLLELVQLVKAPNGKNELLISFIDGEPPGSLSQNGEAHSYPLSINVLREKFRQYFFSFRKLGQKIKNAKSSMLLSGFRDKIILALPESINMAQKIKALELTGHWLQALPEGLADLKQLNSLSLRNNKLKSFPEVLFKFRGQLKYLDLRDNPLPYGLDIEAKSKPEIEALFDKAESFRPKNLIEKLHGIQSGAAEDFETGIDKLYQLIDTSSIKMKGKKNEIQNLRFRYYQNETNFLKLRVEHSIYQTENNKIFQAFQSLIEEVQNCLAKPET